jgi:hypothetical protein
MPWLMRVGTVLSAVLVVIWLGVVPLAAFDVGHYFINGRTVTGPYFLAHAHPVLFPFLAVGAVLAYGYWTEQLWARPLLSGIVFTSRL